MCLGIPMLIVEKNGNDGIAESGGVRRGVRLDLLDTVSIGDYVLIHAGYAIEKLDAEEALEINPKLEIIEISCTTGAGFDRWIAWIEAFAEATGRR